MIHIKECVRLLEENNIEHVAVIEPGIATIQFKTSILPLMHFRSLEIQERPQEYVDNILAIEDGTVWISSTGWGIPIETESRLDRMEFVRLTGYTKVVLVFI